jgi:hypothetical protein
VRCVSTVRWKHPTALLPVTRSETCVPLQDFSRRFAKTETSGEVGSSPCDCVADAVPIDPRCKRGPDRDSGDLEEGSVASASHRLAAW